jgi:hypothetical protein
MYTTEGQSPPKQRKAEEKTMISYGLAKARAMAGRDDWNEREAIKSATILWYDTEEEGYELEIENEDDLDAEDFRAWVEENADSLAQKDAAANGTTFEGIEEIEYETEWIDDDALFDADYEAACESEWEWMTGR